MKKSYSILALLFGILFMLTSCAGYNGIMREHLEDRDNYNTYKGEIVDIYYYDPDSNEIIYDLHPDEYATRELVFEITFSDEESVRTFLGSGPSLERAFTDYRFSFTVTKENSKILAENGFYDVYTANTPIEICASDFIYMDTDFFYIAAVTYEQNEYLSFDDGFANIKDMVSGNKSLL